MELTPWIWQQFTDSDGSALSAGKVYTYFNGTTVKATTYQDAAGTTPNANPIILEADGFPPGGQVFLPVGVAYSFLVTDANDATVRTIDDIEAKASGTITTDYTVMVDGSDPMPAYLGLKLTEGTGVTITPVTGGPNGTVLEISAAGGSAQWEAVAIGGADYLTPITGLPQKLYASDAMMAEKTVTAGAYLGLTARENYVRMDGENGTLVLNQSVTGSTNTGLFFGVNDSTQRAKIQATKNIGDPAKLEISALMTGTKTSSGWLALDADNCLTLATPSPSDVGAQPASTNLGSIASLADAVGWLKNSGTGVFSYTTPTAADVGAIPVGGAVLSVTASGTSITVGGTATNPTVAINLANANNWTAQQAFVGSSASEISPAYSENSMDNAAAQTSYYLQIKRGGNLYWGAINVTSAGSGGTKIGLMFERATTSATLAVDCDGETLSVNPRATGSLSLGTSALKWGDIYGASLYATNATFDGNLTVNGNTTIGDATSDTLTVNATSTFNATLSTAGAIIVSARDGIPKISIKETFSSSSTERFGTLEWIESQTTAAKYQIYHWSHNSTVTPDQVSHYHHNGTNGVYTYDLLADHTHNFRTAVTLASLAGTGTRFATASSTGLLGAVDLFGTANTWTANQTVQTLYTGQAVVSDWYTTYARFANRNANSDQGFGLVQDNAGQVFLRGQTTTVLGATTGYYLEVSVGAVTPYATGASTLGSASKRWGATYLGSLDVSGNTKTTGRQKAVASKTADYTLVVTDEVVVLTGTTGRTFTLPDASGSGQVFNLCNECTGGALLTIALNTGDSVNGSTASFTIPQNQSVTVCDYADEKWVIL